MPVRSLSSRTRTCEDVHDQAPGRAGREDGTLNQLHRLLGRVAVALVRRGAHDRHPPDVGRYLTRLCTRGVLLQAGCHVWDALDVVPVEDVLALLAGVDQDAVVLLGPAPLATSTEVVGPDHLVQEILSPEDLITHQLGP